MLLDVHQTGAGLVYRQKTGGKGLGETGLFLVRFQTFTPNTENRMRWNEIVEYVGSLFEGARYLGEMANLRERSTGVPGLIFISVGYGRHASRVKYYPDGVRGGRSISVGISPNASLKAFSGMKRNEAIKLMKLVEPWIDLNRAALEDFHKNGRDYDSEELIAMIRGLRRV